MSAITNVWRQLVQRRLWPVAILLIAALAAVPLALAQDQEPAPAAPPPPAATDASGETALATDPIVAKATTADRSKRRKVLGSAKNPFGVAETNNGSAAPGDSAGSTVAQTTDTSDAKSDGSSDGSSGTDTPASTAPTGTTPTDTTPQPAPKKYEQYELTVRFGGAEDSKRQSVKKLQPLPSAELPVLIYMGVLKDGKTAVFLVDQGVTPVGDGECKPSPEQCETIRLREGETEFLDVTDDTGNVSQQYQLDLIKIHKGSSASASSAKASHARAKSASRRSELRSVAGRVSAYLP
jgi:hypothetical protein